MTSKSRMSVRILGTISVAAMIALAGCGSKDKPPLVLVPVSGKVTLDGSPLNVGNINFVADESKGNKSKVNAAGMIGEGGSYKLYVDNKEGAPVGWYKVSVSPAAMTMGASSDPTKMQDAKNFRKEQPPVNPKFQSPESSGISIEVKDKAEPGAYDIKVTK